MTFLQKTLGTLAIVAAAIAFAPSAVADDGPIPTAAVELGSACDAQSAMTADDAVAETAVTSGQDGSIVIYRPLFQSRGSGAGGPSDGGFFSFAIPDPGSQCFGSCDCSSCTCDSSCSLSECQSGCHSCFSRVDPGGC